jgi:hypothetical protein
MGEVNRQERSVASAEPWRRRAAAGEQRQGKAKTEPESEEIL